MICIIIHIAYHDLKPIIDYFSVYIKKQTILYYQKFITFLWLLLTGLLYDFLENRIMTNMTNNFDFFDKLKEQLIRHEGEVNHAYHDSEGYLTIGVGHLIDERKGGSISHAAAMFILDEDVRDVLHQCDREFEWFDGLSENRKLVILNMVFNLGMTNFKGFKKTIAYIEAGDFYNASFEMLNSKWAKQVGARANELSNMMREG